MNIKISKSKPAKNTKTLIMDYDTDSTSDTYFKRGDLIGYEPCNHLEAFQADDIVISCVNGRKRVCKLNNGEPVDMATGDRYDLKTVIGVLKAFYRDWNLGTENANPFFKKIAERFL